MLKRLVILIDGINVAYQCGTEDPNQSSIHRLKQLVRDGVCPSGGALVQISSYYVATSSVPRLRDRFRTKVSNDNTDELVRSIVKEVCSTLEHPRDELWLYGSGHGAFVARAVAGLVHRMGLPKNPLSIPFNELFDSTCALIKAQLEDDYLHGPQLIQKIKCYCNGPPRIPFVGLFDTVKLSSSGISYDVSFNSSIMTLRHALALNENRSNRMPELLQLPGDADLSSHSVVQAWFLGTNEDLCGGTTDDGLSLYPLQWVLLESIRAGLSLVSMEKPTGSENLLALVFPQYAGNLPNLDGSEDIEWRLRYSNGIEISMFDLQSSHSADLGIKGDTHSLKLSSECYSRGSTRKIFGVGGLEGWNGNDPHGTIIHPSLFCILDRYPRYLELPNLKPLKGKISNFQDTGLVDDNNQLAPWLQDMQLQASGVKAFRILVCGKTGVGKSTLINKVFGVELTSESESYDQGVHDINEAFESPRHPGLLIHDSRGWQAGSDDELDLIAKFLRNRAFQEDPAKALHVIWFCVDADVSRIEEADKRTFSTIAQFSHHVPVFVVGTKKDTLTGYRKMQLLEELMEKTDDYKQANMIAEEQANKVASDQFAQLRNQLSQIEHYKADGFCCISKNDDIGVKDLLSQTLGLIADERVRLFCVAAQVVDVEQKINSAITECMRLGTHAIRTAAVPLPFSGIIGTPTVSRLICEHVLQCFGFPKTTPAEVERIMSDIVMGNLKNFMKVSLTQFGAVSAVAVGVAVPTLGIGIIVGAAGCILSLPPTARMLLKCSCDMILILERSFRYGGKYVSLRQIENAAKYYTNTTIKTFSGQEKLLQQQVHDEIDQLIPLKNLAVGFKFNKLRNDFESIIYNNRFGKPPDYESLKGSSSLALSNVQSRWSELDAGPAASELSGDISHSTAPPSNLVAAKTLQKPAVELDTTEVSGSPTPPTSAVRSDFGSPVDTTIADATTTTRGSVNSTGKLAELPVQPPELEGDTLISSPREELEGSVPVKSKTHSSSSSRWGKLSSWTSRKSKTK
ncbi:Fc.00g105900.m01.CDS01 [Cosmosporella sp. VM-42]